MLVGQDGIVICCSDCKSKKSVGRKKQKEKWEKQSKKKNSLWKSDFFVYLS